MNYAVELIEKNIILLKTDRGTFERNSKLTNVTIETYENVKTDIQNQLDIYDKRIEELTAALNLISQIV